MSIDGLLEFGTNYNDILSRTTDHFFLQEQSEIRDGQAWAKVQLLMTQLAEEGYDNGPQKVAELKAEIEALPEDSEARPEILALLDQAPTQSTSDGWGDFKALLDGEDFVERIAPEGFSWEEMSQMKDYFFEHEKLMTLLGKILAADFSVGQGIIQKYA